MFRPEDDFDQRYSLAVQAKNELIHLYYEKNSIHMVQVNVDKFNRCFIVVSALSEIDLQAIPEYYTVKDEFNNPHSIPICKQINKITVVGTKALANQKIVPYTPKPSLS